MQVTARVDYGVRAVVEIALHTEPTRARDISERQGIPARFLEGILLDLARADILHARRGPRGGYTLGRPADRISIADVVRAIDGPLAAVRGLAPEDTSYPASSVEIRTLWVALRASMRVVLEQTSIAMLVAGRFDPTTAQLLESPGAWERRTDGGGD